ncbi:MAG: DUF4388 domain-containing protein [Acidimicrobiia bacterium]
MSLSGKLEIFPLEEVLRLLSRSHQTGCLRIEGQGAGRIYMNSGSITYAAVEADEALRARLLSAGLVTEEGMRQVETSNGSLTEALAPSSSTAALAEEIREQTVESVYRIRRPKTGPFSFSVDARPRYATGQSFDVEMIVSEADRRAVEWSEIEEVVPDLMVPWRMIPEIDEESVKLSDTAWRFLAALEGGASVEEMSKRLGMTEFQAARRTAELSRVRLIEPLGEARREESHEPPLVERGPESYEAQPAQPQQQQEPSQVVEPAPERSWWEEEAQSTPARADTEQAPAADETFLEKVFGELEHSEGEDASQSESEASKSDDDHDDDDDGDAGFGLLRRRGLGAAFRELADS